MSIHHRPGRIVGDNTSGYGPRQHRRRRQLTARGTVLSAPIVKVSRNNQIAVPAVARRQLAIGPGDRLDVHVRDGAIVLRPVRGTLTDELRDLAPEIWQGIDPGGYLDELRNEWSHRER